MTKYNLLTDLVFHNHVTLNRSFYDDVCEEGKRKKRRFKLLKTNPVQSSMFEEANNPNWNDHS